MDKLRTDPEVKAKLLEMQKLWPFSSSWLNRRSPPEIREEIKEYAKSDEDVSTHLSTTSKRLKIHFYDVPLQTADVTLDLSIFHRKLKGSPVPGFFQLLCALNCAIMRGRQCKGSEGMGRFIWILIRENDPRQEAAWNRSYPGYHATVFTPVRIKLHTKAKMTSLHGWLLAIVTSNGHRDSSRRNDWKTIFIDHGMGIVIGDNDYRWRCQMFHRT